MKVNSLKVGTVWALLGQFISVFFGFAILVLTSRYLGPDNYGLLQSILTLIVLSAMISDLGLSSSVARYIAKNQNNEKSKSNYIVSGLILKIFTTVVIILIFLRLLPIIENILKIELQEYTHLLIAITILRSFKEFFLKVLQGLRRFDIHTKFNIFYNILHTILIAFFLVYGYGVKSVLISEVIVTIIFIILFSYMNTSMSLFSLFEVNKTIFKNIVKYSVPLFFISMSFYLYMKSDILMIQYFMDSKAVGYYTLATLIITKLHSPMVAVGQASGPVLASLSSERLSYQIARIIKLTLLLTIPICAGLFLVSSEFVTVFFGTSYSPSINLIQIMTVFLFFYSLNSVLSPILDYLGFAKSRAVMVGISATTNVILNLYFIPEFGIIGAVYSTLITYTIYSITIIITVLKKAIYEKKQYLELTKDFFVILFITILMGLIVFVTQLFNLEDLPSLLLSVVTGMFSYLIFIIKFRIVTKNEFHKFFNRRK